VPEIKITYDVGKTADIVAPTTGENGFVSFPFNTNLYKKVTMVDIKFDASSAINSLEYPYCPQTPKPQISIKKYAGPPGLCTAVGVHLMKDDEYILPSNYAHFAYCYEITVPSSSDECVYDIVLNGPAPIGGTGSPKAVTSKNQLLCPGEKIYVAGLTKTCSYGDEGPIDATVDGYGYYSGNVVHSQDPASIKHLRKERKRQFVTSYP